MSNYVYVVNEKLETSGLINYCQMNSAHILQWFPAQLVVKHTLRHYIFQVGSRTCSLSLSMCPIDIQMYEIICSGYSLDQTAHYHQ